MPKGKKLLKPKVQKRANEIVISSAHEEYWLTHPTERYQSLLTTKIFKEISKTQFGTTSIYLSLVATDMNIHRVPLILDYLLKQYLIADHIILHYDGVNATKELEKYKPWLIINRTRTISNILSFSEYAMKNGLVDTGDKITKPVVICITIQCDQYYHPLMVSEMARVQLLSNFKCALSLNGNAIKDHLEKKQIKLQPGNIVELIDNKIACSYSMFHLKPLKLVEYYNKFLNIKRSIDDKNVHQIIDLLVNDENIFVSNYMESLGLLKGIHITPIYNNGMMTEAPWYYNNRPSEDDLVIRHKTILSLLYRLNEFHFPANPETLKMVNISVQDESICEFVSLTGIMRNCDIYPKLDFNQYKYNSEMFSLENYHKNYEGDNMLIFVITSQLPGFIIDYLPKIIENGWHFTLVTGGADVTAPKAINDRYDLDDLLDCEYLKKWYMTNYDVKEDDVKEEDENDFSFDLKITPERHRKIHYLPYGIDYHTHMYNYSAISKKKSAINQESNLKKFINLSDKQSNLLISFKSSCENNEHRKNVFNKISTCGYNKCITGLVTRNDFWKGLSVFKYIACPRGLSNDTSRVWESLILGSYPVVESSLGYLANDYPVIVLPEELEWDSLNEDSLCEFDKYLLEWLSKDENKNWRERLGLKYWLNMIGVNK